MEAPNPAGGQPRDKWELMGVFLGVMIILFEAADGLGIGRPDPFEISQILLAVFVILQSLRLYRMSGEIPKSSESEENLG